LEQVQRQVGLLMEGGWETPAEPPAPYIVPPEQPALAALAGGSEEGTR